MSTAPLKIQIDSQEVPTATKRLDALREMGKKVEAQATSVAKKSKTVTDAVKKTGNEAKAASGRVKQLSNNLKGIASGSKSATAGLKGITTNITAIGRAAGPIGAIVGTITGMTTALTAAGVAAAEATKEITVLSQRANADTTTFQEWAFAVSKVNMSQRDLSDVLQDTNDKLADFRESGGGELADFFENIAPKVGVTADMFRDLSGPDALLLYYDSLEKAGLSQQEMTFYMESMASESTRMIPLLQNNAKGLDEMTTKARDFGLTVSELEIKRLEDISGQFGQIKQQLSNELISAVSQFDGVIKTSLEGISWLINEVADGFAAFMDSFRDPANKRSIEAIDDELSTLGEKKAWLENQVELHAKERNALEARYHKQYLARLAEVDAEYAALQARKDELEKPLQVSRAPRATVDRVRANTPDAPEPTGETASERRAREAEEKKAAAAEKAAAREAAANKRRAAAAARAQAATEAREQAAADRKAERLKAEYAREEEALNEARREQFETLMESLKSEEQILSESYKRRMGIILLNTEEGSRARFELQKKLAEEFAEESLDGFGEASSEDKLESEMAKINEEFAARRELILNNTAITEEQRTELEVELTRRRNEMVAAMEKQKTDATVTATSDMFSNLAEATKAYAGEQSKEYKAMFAVSRAFSIAQTTMKTYEAAQGAYSAMASIPYVGPFLGAAAAAAAVAAGMASVASVKSTSFAGAFDKGGSIPAGQIGLVGEYGPELVEGPMTVTSRKDTAKAFKEGTSGEGAAPQTQPNNVRIINTVDPSIMGDYLGSDAGEEVILNVIRNNGSQIQQIVGG